MNNEYTEVVGYLESLQIMPKTMPGLQKIQTALAKTNWFKKIDPNKVVVVAGTNGKGSTCAALEALLVDAEQNVGFYSSPHLVNTTERIRINSQEISPETFVKIFRKCESIIKECELSHFEALTFMAGHYFFSEEYSLNLDFVIFEVGLGGLFDATNAFPHKYNIITKLGIDHVNILGPTLVDIAKNKFGIIGKKGIVVHHPLPPELHDLKMQFQKQTNSNWIESDPVVLTKFKEGPIPKYMMQFLDLKFEINLLGERAAENIMTAIAAFHVLGFNLNGHTSALSKINWKGRMQRLPSNKFACPIYLSGDHNLQGIESLIAILKDFKWNNLFLIVGIGVDKQADAMFAELMKLENVKLFLTETPFKGQQVEDYSELVREKAIGASKDIFELLKVVGAQAKSEDLCVVTGSLYLVGQVLARTTSI